MLIPLKQLSMVLMKHGKMRQKNFIRLKQKLSKQVELVPKNLRLLKTLKMIQMMFKMLILKKLNN
jgi:hypothetical protein